jgi:hypothetical protein
MVRQFQIGIGGIHAPAGTHVCHFGSRSSGARIAADVIATGLANGERCLLVGDDPFAQPVLRHLRSKKVDVDGVLKQRSLIHIRGQESGVELFGSIVPHLENQPPAGARLAGSSSWNKHGRPTMNDLVAYEALLDKVVSDYHAFFFCTYDRQAAPADVMHTHPKMIVGKEIVENPGYIAPADMRHRLRVSFPGK